MSKNEFYIGWQEEMPASTKSFIRNILLGIFVLIPVLVFAVVNFQKPMNHHNFEFGTSTQLTGIYNSEPFPMLHVLSGVPEGFSKDVLLVGFGKFGADEIISDIENKNGNLDGKEVTIKGTLIYGDGITLIELTDLENSFISAKVTAKEYDGPQTKANDVTLTGEILDPKCYFGVMKPGEGKIHKSCAIRCISGGIPPVMRVLQENGINYDYYLVKGEKGQNINNEVLPYIAETITVTGMSSLQNSWKVLEIEMESIERKMK